jgi:hypothetical protein
VDTLIAAVAMRATLEDLKSDPGIIMVRDSVSATNPEDAQTAKPATKSSTAKNNGVLAADLIKALGKHRYFERELS